MLLRFRYTLVLLLCAHCCLGQKDEPVRATVYFQTGTAALDAGTDSALAALFLGNSRYERVVLAGHADARGNNKSNLELSRQRTEAVKGWIAANNTIRRTHIEMSFFGERMPVATGKDEASLARNRRVDLLLYEAPGWAQVADLFQSAAPPADKFCINPARDTALVCRQGTVLLYKAHTASIPAGNPCTCITIEVKEAFSKKDILLNNLSSSSGGAPLVSQAMISVEFSCNGKQLASVPNYVLLTPADTPPTGAKVFSGSWLNPNHIDWQATDTNTLAGIPAKTLADCAQQRGGMDDVFRPGKDEACGNCALVFCGLGKWTAGIFNKDKRDTSRAYFSCRETAIKQRRAERERKKREGLLNAYGNAVTPRSSEDSVVRDSCGRIMARFKTNRDQLRRELLQRSLDSARRNGNPVTAASLSELQYSVFATSANGWTNIDWMMKVNPGELEQVELLLAPSAYSDCKIIFKKQRTVLPGLRTKKDRFVFPQLPRGHEAWLLIVHTKTSEGHILYELKSITTGQAVYTPELKEATIPEFVALLNTLL
jgi:hypothetical protein